jgi:hypothetical protein
MLKAVSGISMLFSNRSIIRLETLTIPSLFQIQFKPKSTHSFKATSRKSKRLIRKGAMEVSATTAIGNKLKPKRIF